MSNPLSSPSSAATTTTVAAAAGEMGAALYVPDAQRVVRVVLRPCGDDSDAKACVLTAPLSSTVAEVRSRLAAQLGGGGDNDAESASAASSPSWWSWATGRRGAEQKSARSVRVPTLFLDGRSEGGETPEYVALPADATLESVAVKDGDEGPVTELPLYYTVESKFGDGEELLCLACCAMCACITACCCAAAAANNSSSNKPPPTNTNNNNYYYQNGQQPQGNYNSQQPQANYQQQQQQPVYYNDGGNQVPNTYGVPPATQQPVYGQPVNGQPVYNTNNTATATGTAPPAQYGANYGYTANTTTTTPQPL